MVQNLVAFRLKKFLVERVKLRLLEVDIILDLVFSLCWMLVCITESLYQEETNLADQPSFRSIPTVTWTCHSCLGIALDLRYSWSLARNTCKR